jgi:hypothetical protein
VTSNRCTQSPSHSQIVLYEGDWVHGMNSSLKFDVVHSAGRLDWESRITNTARKDAYAGGDAAVLDALLRPLLATGRRGV